MKNFLLSLVCFLIPSFCFAENPVKDLDVAIKIAESSNKNVLVVFSLEDCKYCDILKKDLKSMKHSDNFVICLLDSRQNKRLTGKMKIKKWPTSVVLVVGKENQGEVSRLVGYENKNKYDSWLKLNAGFFGDGVCGCDCNEDCLCRKNGICTCCGDKDCGCCKCDKDCYCRRNGKCECMKKDGKCDCKKQTFT